MAKNLSLTDTVTIASTGNTSTAITMAGGKIPLVVIIPSAMTGTTMTFQASNNNGANYYDVYYESTQYSATIPTASTRHIALDRRAFEGVKTLRLVVNGAGEAALRTIGVISGE